MRQLFAVSFRQQRRAITNLVCHADRIKASRATIIQLTGVSYKPLAIRCDVKRISRQHTRLSITSEWYTTWIRTYHLTIIHGQQKIHRRTTLTTQFGQIRHLNAMDTTKTLLTADADLSSAHSWGLGVPTKGARRNGPWQVSVSHGR